MKKTKLWNNLLSTKARKAIASALALSLTLSGAVYATSGTSKTDGSIADAKAAAVAFVSGDVNGDGSVTLEDAQLALKGALKIKTDFTKLQLYAADVDSNDKLELTDAQMILKAALKIQALPDKPAPGGSSEQPEVSTEPVDSEEPVETPTPPRQSRLPAPDETNQPQPSRTPRPSLEPVVADPANIVSDYESVTVKNVKKTNQVQIVTAAGVEGKEYEQYVFGPASVDDVSQEALDAVSAAGLKITAEDVVAEEGLEMTHPFKGHTEFVENIEDVIRTYRINDRPIVWELTGAAIIPTQESVDLKTVDPRVSNAEPQGYKFCDEENVDYTIPEWTKGMSFSFWVKTDSLTNGDPILTFANDQYIFSVKLNGSVRFLDATSLKGRNCLELQSDQIVDGFGEWSYYTITIKNDWVQVYVNGQENVYTKVSMNRSVIQKFNDGFLTRYNPVSVVTKEQAEKDVRKYYTGVDSTGHSAWYYNSETGQYEGHDEFSIFVNNRFRGAAHGDPVLMELITDSETKMWIGGTKTAIEPENTAKQFQMNTNVADVRAYNVELTPEQVAACYEYTTVTPEAVTWDLSKATAKDAGGAVSEKLPIAEDGLGSYADYDEANDIVTFKNPNGLAKKMKGVELINPFEDKTEVRETLQDALTGQAIFPYLALNGGTIEVQLTTDAVGCTAYGVQVMRGNFYDVWYGDPGVPGNEMDPPTGTKDTAAPVNSIMTQEELEAAYGDQKWTYQRPKWNKGLSVSFWAKPVEVDDSPILTFYKANNMLLNVSVRGDVYFASLDGNNWYKGSVAANSNPYNSFSALGDASYVNAGEWNYYTVTIANDWIQVYVNGKEMVYTEANINRGYNKYFNKGYLSRYNVIGNWTTDMVAKQGDPSGVTLEKTPRNYLTKSGYLYDLSITELWYDEKNALYHSALSDKGFNSGMDSASIRQTGVYANPFNAVNDYAKLLIDYMTDSKVKLYLGGCPSVISLANQFMFQDLQMSLEDAASEEVRSKVHFNDVIYYTDAAGESTGEEQVVSRCKFFFSDHMLDEGTMVTGFSSYLEELSPEEVAENYETALENAPTK